ncbi:cucumisin-like [Vicia villosa]|uniref:cucumisin-like n=1 Tax=Vicia villosa TaxID=3911 RepID=UPI00273BD84E|nr:cucumisin-like [Vicia villosa]
MKLRSLVVLLRLLSLTSLFVKWYYLSSRQNDLETYIVYTGDPFKDEATSLQHYNYLIQQAADSNSAPKNILYYYWHTFSGFVVNLTKKEADRMAVLDEVVSVFRNENYTLLTI